jgi:hypothetical protein
MHKLQSNEILLNLSMKCWNGPCNPQGWRVIIVVVQVGALKIYVAAMEVLRENERQGETQFTTKNWWFLEFHPSRWMLMYYFARFFGISPSVWPNSGFWCCVFLTLRITLIYASWTHETKQQHICTVQRNCPSSSDVPSCTDHIEVLTMYSYAWGLSFNAMRICPLQAQLG